MSLLKSILVTLCLGLCLVSPAISQTTNYCDASLCGTNKQHIACNNNGSFAAVCPAIVKIIPIKDAIRLAIVKKHNVLRNKIATGSFNGYRPAIRMAPMRWNQELAKLAEFNVIQCVMRHDQCRNTAKFHKAGQNLAQSSWKVGQTRTVISETTKHIQLWFKEWRNCQMAIINNFKLETDKTKPYGHFTAMMQEKSIAVGCAILRQRSDGRVIQRITCNYATTNVLNKPVYRKGPVASNCTTGTHSAYPALCSIKEVYDVNNANSF